MLRAVACRFVPWALDSVSSNFLVAEPTIALCERPGGDDPSDLVSLVVPRCHGGGDPEIQRKAEGSSVPVKPSFNQRLVY